MSVQVQVFTDPSLATIPSAFQIVAEGVTRGVKAAHKEALQDLYQYSAQIFEDSIERPGTSVTAGGRSYRAGSRATGNFTFGSGGTFQGQLFESGPVQGIAYPDTARADQQTNRAWRVLEQGTASLRMPRGIWRDAGGQRVPPAAGNDDEFHPTGRGGFREVSGIQAKWFIRDSVNQVADELEQRYFDIADEVASEVGRFAAPRSPERPPPPGPEFTVWVQTGRVIQSGPAAGFTGYWRRPPGSG